MANFVNRKEELGILKKRILSNKAEFIVIYGRRRVGKSELLNEFLKSNLGIKLLAREEGEDLQLKRFSNNFGNFFKDDVINKSPLTNWDGFFSYVKRYSNKRIVIAIDEFPYLVTENKSLPSIFQDYWDNHFKNSKLCFIICGSSVAMMERTLGHKSPLYGRRTAQILVKPFSFKQSLEYLKIDFENAIGVYSVFGGTPAYLMEYDLKKSFDDNLRDSILRQDSFLFVDVEFVLKEELREPRYYFSVLSSIARGNTKISDIINDTGINKSIVSKYISILHDLLLVRREAPITENPIKSRKGLYILNDNFFKFWFRFVYPNKELIEKADYDTIINEININLKSYIGPIFEGICLEALELNNKSCQRFGRWWHKDKEIDIVALNEKSKEILFCECKFSNNVDANAVLGELKEKAQHVEWNKNKRKEDYIIFAKSFKEKIKVKNLTLVDLRDLEKMFN